YKVTSGSGVMFDALAHGLPFIASDLEFFQEFSKKGLGICVKRNAEKFAKALLYIDKDYEKFALNINRFKNMLKWDFHIAQHIEVYNYILENKKKHTITQSYT
ncbi:MAG: glycosyltransferase, partial [Nitrososphaeraceae archaeon]